MRQRSRYHWPKAKTHPNASTKLLVVNGSGKLAVWLITFHLVTGDQQWRRAFCRWTFACYWLHHAMYKTNLESDHLERSERILFSLSVDSEPKYQLNPPSILCFFCRLYCACIAILWIPEHWCGTLCNVYQAGATPETACSSFAAVC
jgi:hypothetical protein